MCKNKECKDNQVKIEKGTLRFCTQVEMGGHQSWAYKHWWAIRSTRSDLPNANSFIFRGCVTPVQIQNLNNAIENNLDYLDGYAELDPSLQMVVQKALKEGHVDDSDWRGVRPHRPIQSTRLLTVRRTWNKIDQGSRGFVKQLQRRKCWRTKLRYMNHPCIYPLEVVS